MVGVCSTSTLKWPCDSIEAAPIWPTFELVCRPVVGPCSVLPHLSVERETLLLNPIEQSTLA